MKNKLYSLLVLCVLVTLTSCNEKLSIETEVQGAPEIIEFAPVSGKAGTQVTVKGNNLRDIETATIGGVEAQILYKLSQQEIVIVVPREGTKNGKIVLSTSRKNDDSERSWQKTIWKRNTKNINPARRDVRTIRTMVGKQPLSTKPGESL